MDTRIDRESHQLTSPIWGPAPLINTGDISCYKPRDMWKDRVCVCAGRGGGGGALNLEIPTPINANEFWVLESMT